ncbi:MAG: response regulator [Selenomonadaceae bacterium]|nr:response regulator [Selenomonadaceae bacterium]
MREKVVLVIDDDDMNLQIAKMILEKKVKCHVICADNGREGIEILRKERVNLVLLDILMPDFDGIETLQEIRDDENLKNTAVMMLTAASGIDNLKKAYSLGVKDYIKKPFMPADLINRVTKKFEELTPEQTVLLLGKNIDELHAIQDLIEKNFDYESWIALSKIDAQKILRKNQVTLMIADAEMKFVDGFKMLEFISEEEKLKNVPLALTTSKKITELLEKLKAPADEEKIVEKISEHAVTPKDKNGLAKVVTSLIGYELDVHV